MVLWRKATMDTCLACKKNSQSLLHVVSFFYINITLKKLQYNNLSQSQRGKTHDHLVPTMNEFVQLSKNKQTREHNVTLHHSLPITLRYIKDRRKAMRSEAASSHRATSNPQSTICSSFHVHFVSENHRQPHGQKEAAPLLTAPRRTSHYKTVR